MIPPMPPIAGAEEDADSHRVVDAVEAGVRDRLLSGGEPEQHVPVQPPGLLHRHDGGRIEVLDLRRDAHGVARRVEGADEVDAAAAGDRRLPCLASRRADRRDRPQARDGYASHKGSLKVGSGHGTFAPPPEQ